MFTLEISTRNAAFGDTEEDKSYEVLRILKDLEQRIRLEPLRQNFTLRDLNGNQVGYAEFTPDD